MKEKIRLYVCFHKEYPNDLKAPEYCILCEEGDNVSSEAEVRKIKPHISNIGFSEWSKFYEVYKDPEQPDYIGLMHYRRVLLLGRTINDIPDPEELLKDCDLIVGYIFRTDSVREQYKRCHNIKDLDDCQEIIEKEYPEYLDAWKQVMKSDRLFICNTVLMRKEDFNNFCDFLFGVLFKWCEKNGIDPSSDQSFYDYIDRDIKNYSKRHKPDDEKYREQARIGGFLSERLFNVWVVKNGKKIKPAPVVDSKIPSI